MGPFSRLSSEDGEEERKIEAFVSLSFSLRSYSSGRGGYGTVPPKYAPVFAHMHTHAQPC